MGLSVTAEIFYFAGAATLVVDGALLTHPEVVVDTIESLEFGAMDFAGLKLSLICEFSLGISLISFRAFVVFGLLQGKKNLLVDRKHVDAVYAFYGRLAKWTAQFVIDEEIFGAEGTD